MPRHKQIRIDVDWAMHSSYASRRDELITELRPVLLPDFEAGFKRCWGELMRAVPEVQSVTQGEYVELTDGDEIVFVFFGILVNRDNPAAISVFLSPTEEIAKLTGSAWEAACHAELGKGRHIQ